MRLALLGDPVHHSRSPAIHAAALAALGIEGEYLARRSDSAGVSRAVEEIRRGVLDGANVTMPLKAVALDAADTVSVESIRAGSVNTLLLRQGSVCGENTDIIGVRDVWQWRGLPTEAPVLILGAGGAAGAALVALEGWTLWVAARRREAAEALLARSGVAATVLPWGEAVAGAVVVNATPIGMQGEALPEPVMKGARGLLDMAYGEVPTPAVADAEGRMPIVDGLDLLVAQAARSLELWVGRTPPLLEMERAARA